VRKFFAFILIFIIFRISFSLELKNFYELMPEIKDWKASDPVGGRINIDNIYTLKVEREYNSEGKKFKIIILSGEGIEALWKPFLIEVSYKNDNEWRKVRKINKFKLGIYYNKKGKKGELLILYEDKKELIGLLMMEFDNISSDAAIKILKKFNWKAIKELLLEDRKESLKNIKSNSKKE